MNCTRKMSAAQVEEARRLYFLRRSLPSLEALAKRYGVAQSTLRNNILGMHPRINARVRRQKQLRQTSDANRNYA